VTASTTTPQARLLARLAQNAEQIRKAEERVEQLYGQRGDLFLAGRLLDEKVLVRTLAEAGRVSPEAVHKAVARARQRASARL